MNSINLSFASHLLGASSQAQVLVGETRKLRKNERQTRAEELKLDREARRHMRADFKQLMVRYDRDLKEEFDLILLVSKHAVQMLRTVQSRSEKHSEHLKALVEHAGFPKTIGENLAQEIAHTKQVMEHSLSIEVKNERVELSAAERAKAA
jgi:hypothetical protein